MRSPRKRVAREEKVAKGRAMNSPTCQGQMEEELAEVAGKEWPKHQEDDSLSPPGDPSFSAFSPHHHVIPCEI